MSKQLSGIVEKWLKVAQKAEKKMSCKLCGGTGRLLMLNHYVDCECVGATEGPVEVLPITMIGYTSGPYSVKLLGVTKSGSAILDQAEVVAGIDSVLRNNRVVSAKLCSLSIDGCLTIDTNRNLSPSEELWIKITNK